VAAKSHVKEVMVAKMANKLPSNDLKGKKLL